MLSKPRNLKNIKILLISFLFSLSLINTGSIYAQGSQSVKPQRIKVDGVSAVVGDYVILESDIDKAIVEMESQGMSVKNITRCELLGKLMEDKLYAHNAVQDSLEVSDQEIYDYVDQSIAYFTDQLGSIQKVLEFYKKPDELSFRDELFYFILIRDEFMNDDISTSHSPSVIETTPPISLISSQNLVENSFLVFN